MKLPVFVFAVISLSLTSIVCRAQSRVLGADGVHIDSPADVRPAEPPLLVDEKVPSEILSRPKGMWAGNAGNFFAGAFVALAGHEGGHYIANAGVGSHPYLKGVYYGPIPFFTIEPNRPLNHHEHYITASAGFNSQQMINEWLLSAHPNLKDEDQPFLKGVATFNFWLTVGYAATAFAKTGPAERDTKGMADSLGCGESLVGAMILVPTALDTYRYKHPDAKWARDASRLSKLGMIFLAATVHN